MKIDEHLTLGIVVGIIVGLHFGTSLVEYMPFFVVGAVLLLYKKIATK